MLLITDTDMIVCCSATTTQEEFVADKYMNYIPTAVLYADSMKFTLKSLHRSLHGGGQYCNFDRLVV